MLIASPLSSEWFSVSVHLFQGVLHVHMCVCACACLCMPAHNVWSTYHACDACTFLSPKDYDSKTTNKHTNSCSICDSLYITDLKTVYATGMILIAKKVNTGIPGLKAFCLEKQRARKLTNGFYLWTEEYTEQWLCCLHGSSFNYNSTAETIYTLSTTNLSCLCHIFHFGWQCH